MTFFLVIGLFGLAAEAHAGQPVYRYKSATPNSLPKGGGEPVRFSIRWTYQNTTTGALRVSPPGPAAPPWARGIFTADGTGAYIYHESPPAAPGASERVFTSTVECESWIAGQQLWGRVNAYYVPNP